MQITPYRPVRGTRPRLGPDPRFKCVATENCAERPIPDAPVALCGGHMREVYEFAADFVTANWDVAIREYIAGLHDKFVAPRRLQSHRPGFIYFIRLGDRVKVGYTTNVKQRLAVLPHEEVVGILPGSKLDERGWHELLADFRTAGEWFRAEPELLAMIEQVVSKTA